MIRLFQGKVDETIVHQIDLAAIRKKFTAGSLKSRWIRDDRRNSLTLERCLGEQKLRIEMLIKGRVIDDRNHVGCPGAALA